MTEAEKQAGKGKKVFLERIKAAWQFFKEKYPDWIMVDINGNPLEEVLRQSPEE